MAAEIQLPCKWPESVSMLHFLRLYTVVAWLGVLLNQISMHTSSSTQFNDGEAVLLIYLVSLANLSVFVYFSGRQALHFCDYSGTSCVLPVFGFASAMCAFISHKVDLSIFFVSLANLNASVCFSGHQGLQISKFCAAAAKIRLRLTDVCCQER